MGVIMKMQVELSETEIAECVKFFFAAKQPTWHIGDPKIITVRGKGTRDAFDVEQGETVKDAVNPPVDSLPL